MTTQSFPLEFVTWRVHATLFIKVGPIPGPFLVVPTTAGRPRGYVHFTNTQEEFFLTDQIGGSGE